MQNGAACTVLVHATVRQEWPIRAVTCTWNARRAREPAARTPSGISPAAARCAAGAAQYAVNSRRLGEPVPGEVTLPGVELVISALATPAGVAVGLLCR
jgi:hypothetical protein